MISIPSALSFEYKGGDKWQQVQAWLKSAGGMD
jgi:hypothetical protein